MVPMTRSVFSNKHITEQIDNLGSDQNDEEPSGCSNTSNIPADIWREVFLKCLPEYPTAASNRKPPLIFTEVSRTWRGIALCTPRLWNSLCIEWYSAMDIETNKTLEIHAETERGASSWLQRSGSLPLTLVLKEKWIQFCSFPSSYEFTRHVWSIVQICVQHSYLNRLRILFISCSDTMRQSLSQFTLLESDSDSKITFKTPQPPLSGLTHISLTFTYTIFGPPMLASATLRTLSCRCKTLKYCKLHYESDRYSELFHPTTIPQPTPPLQYSSLKQLVLSFDYVLSTINRAIIQDTFDAIRAPNLTHLELHISPGLNQDKVTGHVAESKEPPFHRFLVESKCRLTSLGLHMPFGHPVLRTIDDLLSPSLTHLAVTYFEPEKTHGTRVGKEDTYSPDGNTVSMISDYLIPDAENSMSIRLPRLEELEVTCPASYPLAAMLKALGVKRSWKRFKIHYTDVTEDELKQVSDVMNIEEVLEEEVHWEYNLQGKTEVSAVV